MFWKPESRRTHKWTSRPGDYRPTFNISQDKEPGSVLREGAVQTEAGILSLLAPTL